MDRRLEWILLAVLLAWVLGLRATQLDQPILENYVGRQIPTAMVARNLERGSGFLHPQLDTEPTPNLFLVEPPIYAATVVGLRRLTGLNLEQAGRCLSALGATLAAWGLFGLVRRREGPAVALLAVAAWSICPLTVRYGRAFQPDMLMMGLWIAGLELLDRGTSRRVPGLFLVALGLTMKVTSAPMLVPLLAILPWKRLPKLLLCLTLLVPAGLWYVHAGRTMALAGGSQASAENGAIWLSVLVPRALLETETWWHAVRFTLLRGFTPPGFVLAIYGFWLGGPFWRQWTLAALAGLLALAAKLHHEYYWLALAPVASVGIARGIAKLWKARRARRIAGLALALVLVGWSHAATRSTWRTPPEWASWDVAIREIERVVPEGESIVAPEALLYLADRRGCRMEYSADSIRRAIREWPGPHPRALEATDLLDFYGTRGATFYADLTTEADPDRRATLDLIRRNYPVVVDGSGVLIVRLRALRGSADGR
ncbi:glycosyltransferase family 39 protein [Isosphaeraceae bacterium EP7]